MEQETIREVSLFVTVPAFEQFVPLGLREAEQRFWVAAALSLNSAWYLFTYEHDGEQEVHTLLASWETSLAELLLSMPDKSRRAIARFDPSPEDNALPWTMRWLESVWLTCPDEGDLGPMVMRFQGEDEVRDSFLQPAASREGRRLVFSA
jgi:hypothetical protein